MLPRQNSEGGYSDCDCSHCCVSSPSQSPSPNRMLRQTSETTSNNNKTRPRPILTKSRSADRLIKKLPKRSVSFQLPEDQSPSGGLTQVTQILKRLAMVKANLQQSKPEKSPKRILRQPVLHVYVRGASGLPTQRVPIASKQALLNSHRRL